MTVRRSALTILGLGVVGILAACDDTLPVEPIAQRERGSLPGTVRIGVEASDLSAPVGSIVQVAITVDAEDSVEVAALQGAIDYDPARLKYVGQIPLDQTLTVVNGAAAESGEVQVLSFRMDGLGRSAVGIGFEVLAKGYAEGLSYQSSLVASRSAGSLEAEVVAGVELASRGAPVGRPFLEATPEELASIAGFRLASELGGPAAVQAQTVRIGDCTQDGAVDALDLVAIARIAVGLDPDITDPSDLRLCDIDLSGGLDVLDVLDVSRFAVGLTPFFGPLGYRFNSIAAGYAHTCALNTSGEAYCWGAGTYGELGNSASVSSPSPVAVSGGLTFVSISAGSGFSCGIATSGATYCWGRNQYGQLGDVSLLDSNEPVLVGGGHDFVVLGELAQDHACGLLATGEAWCWGNSQSGALGDSVNAFAPNPDPVAVKGGITFADIGAAWHTTCAADVAGQAWCWGGYAPPLTPSFPEERALPQQVGTGHVFTQIQPGIDHYCGVDDAGSSWCWGLENDYGEFGNGTLGTTSRFDLFETSGGHTWSRLATGWEATCGLDTGGQAWCWGEADRGQVGDGTSGVVACGISFDLGCRTSPTAVVGGHTFTTITAGWRHICAIDVAGAIWCWGSNSSGQLGVGTDTLETWRNTPSDSVSGATFQSFTLGGSHSCGISVGGTALCWGANSSGQLGNAMRMSAPQPDTVVGGQSFSSLAAGGSFTCGLTTTAQVYCWGGFTSGTLPMSLVGGPATFASLTAGGDAACGLDGGGKAYCWGYNGLGQLGDSTTTARTTADTVFTSLTFDEITGGSGFTCARSGGDAYCWGRNSSGQLGDGTGSVNEVIPVAVAGGLSFVDVDAHPGGGHACGLTGIGEMYCWGANNLGQLGDGTTTDALSPVPVSGGHTFVSIHVGGTFTCGVDGGGQTWCWGANPIGQFGDGSLLDSTTPTLAAGGAVFTEVEAGSTHMCGLDGGGALYCWGSNLNGLLGIGIATDAFSPVQVMSF